MGTLHHLNVGCADASVIKTATATFLIDCYDIGWYASLLPSNKRIRGVFITHQHDDHFAGLQYLRDKGYSIDCLIYSPYVRRWGDNSVTLQEWNDFNSHKDYFKKKGTKLFPVCRQADFDEPYWDTNGVAFWMIAPFRALVVSDTRKLHDASLVITAHLNKRRCLFAGDASDLSLTKVAENTKDFCNDILHASHHGSLEGADLSFVKGCNTQYTVISTKSGVYDNVPHPTALRRYKENTAHDVRRTDVDGTWRWTF